MFYLRTGDYYCRAFDDGICPYEFPIFSCDGKVPEFAAIAGFKPSASFVEVQNNTRSVDLHLAIYWPHGINLLSVAELARAQQYGCSQIFLVEGVNVIPFSSMITCGEVSVRSIHIGFQLCF
ncbi:MAG TPA: hypothetical protein DCW53_05995, partial [Rikenellaceae bacterium]|nr:hypothetical protein [Rikenellaceae bacterium]